VPVSDTRPSTDSTITAQLGLDTVSVDTLNRNRLTNPLGPEGVPVLDAFFAALHADQIAGKPPRIGFYGDSQIEGDRITQVIRYRLHRSLGGKGLGYIPFEEPATHHSLTRTTRGSWYQYTCHQNRYTSNYYGPAGRVYRIQKPLKGEALQAILEGGERVRSSVRLKLAAGVVYDRLHLWWGKAPAPVVVRCMFADSTTVDTLRPTDRFEITALRVPPNTLDVRVEFEAVASPDLYGFSLDGETGVQLDNFGIRGHAGQGLYKINPFYWAQALRDLNTRLIVLQYGNNVVPGENAHQTEYIEREFYGLYSRIRQLAPGAAILAISVGDMGHRVEGKAVSYATVPLVRDAQKRAAERAGIAFWDYLSAMGGPGTIIEWAHRKPALAVSDYGHLTPRGQFHVADLFYSALMKEYNSYVVRRGRKPEPQPQP
jgi:hypothetical protein